MPRLTYRGTPKKFKNKFANFKEDTELASKTVSIVMAQEIVKNIRAIARAEHPLSKGTLAQYLESKVHVIKDDIGEGIIRYRFGLWESDKIGFRIILVHEFGAVIQVTDRMRRWWGARAIDTPGVVPISASIIVITEKAFIRDALRKESNKRYLINQLKFGALAGRRGQPGGRKASGAGLLGFFKKE